MNEKIINADLFKNQDKYKKQFLNAKPFCYVAIDNFLEEDFFKYLSKELFDYYEDNKNKGIRWNTQAEDGKWGSTGLDIPNALRRLDTFLKSHEFLKFLEGISGFANLKVTKNINGKGFSFFHAMKPGAFLAPHTDHTRDLNNGPYHVLNVIIYASEMWNPNWGGATTIYDDKVRMVSDVEYKPNRALIFMHSPWSIHGTQRVSTLAEIPRFSTYYDYYTEDDNPYEHMGIRGVKLIDSPHLFYLDKKKSYFKKGNRRYMFMHLSHFKKKLIALLTR